MIIRDWPQKGQYPSKEIDCYCGFVGQEADVIEMMFACII